MLRVEHGDRSAVALSGVECGGEVVGSGAGGDDGAGRVEDRVDDDVEAFTGAGRADEQDRVFDRCPDLRAVAGAEKIGDVRWGRGVQGGA